MRYRNISKWDNPESSANLLFFAQLMEELLFEFSLDTYKPSAMNSSLLCSEALEVINEIEEGNIKAPNLDHVLKELCENLKRDKVSQSLLTIETSQIEPILLDPRKNSLEKKIVIEIIKRQISLKNYKRKNEELLIKVIKNEEKKFLEIRSLSRSYITTLINIKYGTKYLYEIVLDFFYYGKNRIAGNVAIEEFIKIFNNNQNEYRIISRASSLFEKISSSCKIFDIEILKQLPEEISDTQNFTKKENEVFVCVNNIKARDIHSAKAISDSKLELISTIFSLFHHKESPKFQHDCLVINSKTKETKRSKKSINIMHKCIDLKPLEAARRMNGFISEFSLEENSFHKFTRSAELHSLALKSDSIENQMINLWIALESIIPANKSGNQSTIENIVNSTLPFLNAIYFQRLLSRFARDLINWKKSAFIRIIKKIDGDGIIQKLIKLIALPEFEKERDLLKSEFKDFHLIADRFDYFCESFSSPEKLLERLENHSKRVEWQLRRIYRARNLIVHSGKTPSYTGILIENIHDYLDVIMSTLIALATKPKIIVSIDQGFKYLELTHESYKKDLKKKKTPFDRELILKLFPEKSGTI